MKSSLHLKFALSISLIIVATSILLGTMFTSIQVRTMEKHLRDKGFSLVEFFADHSEFGLRFHDQEQLQSMISSLLAQDDVAYALITDADDAVLLHQSARGGSGMDAPYRSFPIREVTEPGYHALANPDSGDLVYHFVAPISASTFRTENPALHLVSGGPGPETVVERIGVAHLGISRQGMEAAIKAARIRLLGLLMVIVVAGIATAIVLSMYVTRPIQSLMHATHQIADGNLTVNLPDESNDEIGAMARSFNTMTRTLKETMVSREHAEQANLAKSEFLANMSHELRTPVHSILSFAELGMEKAGEAPPEKLTDYYREIEQNGRILLQLLNGLLDLSKLEAGKMVFCFEAADLVVLAQSVIDEFERLCSEHRLTLQVAFPKTPLPCIVDPDKMRQVLRNVLANAVKYSPEERDIEVTLQGRDGRMEVTVCDRGPGIPEKEIEAIFEEFVQSSHTKTGAGGTGLGLSISRQIIHRHDGRIWVKNREGGGACFGITLPERPLFLSEAEARKILNEKHVLQISL